MTAPDPVELAAPVDPAAYRPRRSLFSAGFWAAMAFCVLCVAGGAALVRFGPALWPVKPPAAPAKPIPAAATPTIDQRLADIQARLQAQETAAVSPPAGAGPADLETLKARVARLEADRTRLTQAAAAALAAATLSQSASGSRPFAGELEAMEAALPDSADLRALRPLAQSGAPTAASLAAAFPDAAARAAVASRARTQGSGVLARIAQAFAAIVTIRRVDRSQGGGVDAALARADRRVEDGDLEGALGELGALPPAGREAMAGWIQRAQRRVEIDRRLVGVRLEALAALSRARQEPQP